MWAGLLRLPPSKRDGDGKAGPRLVESTFSQSGDRYLVCTGSSISFNLCFNFPSPVCFPLSSGRNPNITLQPPPPPPHHSQSPIKAKSLPLLFRHPETNSNISTGTCKGNCPCGKMSKSPIVVPLLPRPRDTTALSVGHIYLNVQIFPLLYCVTSLDKQQTVEKCLSTQER